MLKVRHTVWMGPPGIYTHLTHHIHPQKDTCHDSRSLHTTVLHTKYTYCITFCEYFTGAFNSMWNNYMITCAKLH